MEIRHVPSYYEKPQLPSLTSTKLVFFDKFNVKQVSGPPTTSRLNKYNVVFPRNEEGRVGVKRDVYETKNQPKKSTFKYDQEGRFCIGLDKVESKEDGKIIGKHCPVFYYTGEKFVTIYAYKKEILNEFAGIRKLTSSSSPWVKKIKTDKIWLSESLGKLKGIVKQREVK